MKKVLISILLTLITIISFNYFVDSSGRYYTKKKIIKKSLYELEQNNYFYATQNFFERLLKKELIKKNKNNNIEIVICGSSRAAIMNEKIIGNSNFLNLAFSFSTLFDSLIMCDYAYSKLRSNKMIIVLDYYYFIDLDNKHFKYEWISLFQDKKFKDYKKKLSTKTYLYYITNYYFSLFKNLLSYDLLKENVIKLYDKNKENKNFLKINSNGSFEINFDSNSQINLKDKERYAENHLKFAKTINQENLLFFEKYLEKNKKNIEIYLLPYSPIYYKTLKKSKVITELNNKIEEISKKNKIKILGSYNPNDFFCDEKNFSDAVHPDIKCLTKIK